MRGILDQMYISEDAKEMIWRIAENNEKRLIMLSFTLLSQVEIIDLQIGQGNESSVSEIIGVLEKVVQEFELKDRGMVESSDIAINWFSGEAN